MPARHGTLVAAWYRGAWWLWLLRPLEFFFRALAACRRTLYHWRLLRSYRPERPVVIIGNITVGGTGKTPVVIALVEALQDRGLLPGVVSRGYGACETGFPYNVIGESDAVQCGDEPLLIHHRTGAPCVVDPKRVDAVAELSAQFDVDIVISDDGLQHYALQRDMEIVLIDAERGLGNGFCLPAGPLREPASRLKSVDYVLYRNGSNSVNAVTYQPEVWQNVRSGEERALNFFAAHDGVTAIAGIGQPEQFFDSLRALGISAATRGFPDHHHYVAEDFAGLAGRTILMTEKDAVKCASLAGPDAWFLRISARLPDAVIESVVQLARR